MKRLYVLISTAGLTLTGCNQPVSTTSQNAEQVQPAQPLPPPPPITTSKEPAPEQKSSTAPAEVPKPEPEAPAKQLAPEGTLFVTERVRVVTDDGIRAVNPGTHVKIVRKIDTGYVVADKIGEFPVELRQVTNEVAAASGALENHRAETSAAAAASQAQSQAVAQILQAQKHQAAAESQAADKERRIRELEARYGALVREQAFLDAKIQEAREDASRHQTAIILGRVSTRATDPNLRASWVARVNVIAEEKRATQAQLRREREGQ